MTRVLVVAPHADDEVLGAGGTIARYAAEGHEVTVAVLTGRGPDPHPLGIKCERVRAEAIEAHKVLGVHDTVFRDLPAVLVPDLPVHEVNRVVLDLFMGLRPEVLFIPFLHDMHMDHRRLTYACSVAFRPHTEMGRGIREIYMYETLSETHWNLHNNEGGFLPNVYIDISGPFLERKLEALSLYQSQIRPFPDARSLEGLEALARFRGCSVGVRAAEAFVLARKLI